MRKSVGAALAAAAMLSAVAPAAAAVSLTNGSFETIGALYLNAIGGIYEATGWTNLSGYNIQASSVGATAEGGFIFGTDGARYLRLAADAPDPQNTGLIGQNLGTMVAGETYTITADYSGGASTNAQWGATALLGSGIGFAPATIYDSQTVGSVLGQTVLGGLVLSYTATAQDAGQSLFLTLYATPVGAGQATRGGFDNFRLATIGVGTVPEPAGWALLIAGFGLVGAVQRRRRGALTAS